MTDRTDDHPPGMEGVIEPAEAEHVEATPAEGEPVDVDAAPELEVEAAPADLVPPPEETPTPVGVDHNPEIEVAPAPAETPTPTADVPATAEGVRPLPTTVSVDNGENPMDEVREFFGKYGRPIGIGFAIGFVGIVVLIIIVVVSGPDKRRTIATDSTDDAETTDDGMTDETVAPTEGNFLPIGESDDSSTTSNNEVNETEVLPPAGEEVKSMNCENKHRWVPDKVSRDFIRVSGCEFFNPEDVLDCKFVILEDGETGMITNRCILVLE